VTGKPCDPKNPGTRERILAAARDCLGEQGVCGLTIAGVAQRARVAVGTVYAHFPGKRVLFQAVGVTEPDPSGLRGRERKLQVLKAALGVFLDKGYSEATMEDVAERAGLSKAALYEYVSGKEELFALAIRSGIDDAEMGAFPYDGDGIWVGPGEAPRTPEQFLRTVGRWFLSTQHDKHRVAFMRIVITEGTRNPTFAKLHFEHVVLETNRRLSSALMRLGCGPEPAVRDTVLAFTGQLFSWILVNRLLARTAGYDDVPWLADPHADEEAVIERVVQLFLHGDPLLRPGAPVVSAPAEPPDRRGAP